MVENRTNRKLKALSSYKDIEQAERAFKKFFDQEGIVRN